MNKVQFVGKYAVAALCVLDYTAEAMPLTCKHKRFAPTPLQAKVLSSHG